jgi:hypothetical protein
LFADSPVPGTGKKTTATKTQSRLSGSYETDNFYEARAGSVFYVKAASLSESLQDKGLRHRLFINTSENAIFLYSFRFRHLTAEIVPTTANLRQVAGFLEL